jgi:hypothetical protein
MGTYEWPNGERYEGEWLNGNKHGKGTWTSKNGDKYMGEWDNSMAHGYGIH